MARAQRYAVTATVDPAGFASATFTAPNGVLHVDHMRVVVSTDNPQPTATIYVNGMNFEGSYSGANDTSDTSFDVRSGETLECAWSGAAPGAAATLYIWGTQED